MCSSFSAGAILSEGFVENYVDESYQIVEFPRWCLQPPDVRKPLPKSSCFSLVSSDSFSLESPAGLCRISFLGVVHEDEKESGARSALGPNVRENEVPDDVERHDDRQGPGADAAGGVHVVAGTRW